jgi:isocitrate dehydrogenase
MLEYLGWKGAAGRIRRALEKTVSEKILTYDLARQMGVTPVKCSEFGRALLERMD